MSAVARGGDRTGVKFSPESFRAVTAGTGAIRVRGGVEGVGGAAGPGEGGDGGSVQGRRERGVGAAVGGGGGGENAG